MSSFSERPKIDRPLAVALGAVVVLVLLAAAVILAYRSGAGDSGADPDHAIDEDQSADGSGLPGAGEVYDPLETVEGTAYDPDLYIFHGYEYSYVGAVSAASDWLTAYGSSLDPDYSEQLAVSLLVEGAAQTPQDWSQWPVNRREDLGAPESGDLEAGWGLSATPMAYQTRNVTDTEIMVVLLVRLTGTSPYGSTSRNTILSMDLIWTGQDWADAGYTDTPDLSQLHVDPGDESSDLAETLGWRQLINLSESTSHELQ
jgi:hypothetical protein